MAASSPARLADRADATRVDVLAPRRHPGAVRARPGGRAVDARAIEAAADRFLASRTRSRCCPDGEGEAFRRRDGRLLPLDATSSLLHAGAAGARAAAHRAGRRLARHGRRRRWRAAGAGSRRRAADAVSRAAADGRAPVPRRRRRQRGRRQGRDGQDVRARRRARGVAGRRLPVLGVAVARRAARELETAPGSKARASPRCSATSATGALRTVRARRRRSRHGADPAARGAPRPGRGDRAASSCSSATIASCRSSRPAARSADSSTAGSRSSSPRTTAKSTLGARRARPPSRRPRREALARYQAHGRVHVEDTPERSRAKLVADCWALGSPSRSVVLAQRRDDVQDLNTRAREHMRTAGRLERASCDCRVGRSHLRSSGWRSCLINIG